MKASAFIKVFGLDIARMAVNECPPEYDLDTVELKRLVESHELVESYGGLFEAKIYADSEYRSLSAPQLTKRLKQAIADVESCQ